MRRSLLLGLVATLGLAAASVPAASAAPADAQAAAAPAARGATVVEVPITFTVRNVNRSLVPCAPDGATYHVTGSLVGPAAALDRPGGRVEGLATLYLHGLGFGKFLWNYKNVAGYDYATNQAAAGQVSVVIDRLGYGDSDHPVGTAVCTGSQADMADQMVSALRSGGYTLEKRAPLRFAKVVLAGHSYGAQIAQIAAYSFKNVDGLAVIGYSDTVASATAATAQRYAARTCGLGGKRSEKGARNYSTFGKPEDAAANLFANTNNRVLRSALRQINRDECGDLLSYKTGQTADLTYLSQVTAPVLVVSGGKDAIFPPPAGQAQAALFTGSAGVTQVEVPETGHNFTLERTHGQFETAVRSWLETLD
ncbi:alpha/beta fold hydrolase [Motilibacter aurantiacus]|uniref:alpha/beta fold hydrolase n=1 Tax=Motilibacter aurantiacus TaxID=2714955 RepID=UPI0014086208|nr:alpha/beta hydrolase [Motilibacter aurantiacus]NHC44014.1 alpha/beta hydrolase [Motilibacter aurantiacus]